MSTRSQKIILTNEARLLRVLREEHGLSMKRAGKLLGASPSTIAHIETGRMNPPKGEALARLLKVYGGIKEKSFYERVRKFERNLTPREELVELVNRAPDRKALVLLQIAKVLFG